MEHRLRPTLFFIAVAGSFLVAGLPVLAGQGLSVVGASAPAPERIAAPASVDCADGLVYDDDALNEAIRFRDQNDNGLAVDAVMRFDVGQADRKLEQLCVCWNRDGIAPVDFVHEIVFFSADGPGGQPGNLIDAIPFTRNNIPAFPQTSFVSYDLTPFDVRTTGTSIYAGVRWTSGDAGDGSFVLCTDQDGPGQQPMYAAPAGSGIWMPTDDLFAGNPTIQAPTALMVRLEAEEPPPVCPQEPCADDDFTLCLNDGRFAVTTSFRTPQGTMGEGMKEELTEDTGYFWFFDRDNVEVVVKVLDACAAFDHFWVFAGGLTNVEVEIEVCDTEKGVLSTYFNPIRTAFQPIQDTAAFATCP